MPRTPATTEPAAPPHPAVAPALPSDRPTLARATDVSQATAVEQARAVAEVQAAILVAQQVPRDLDRATAEMRDACGRMALASVAFYAVKNRGNGPSVHLMRELARVWGNVDYGVKELRRDDDAHVSEVQAYAWDQQANVRSTRSFIVPHARMADGKRRPLIDLNDVYLNNQNIGARAVRECISTVLPTWFTEAAQDACRETLENGEGVPIDKRRDDVIAAFAALGVDLERLEAKVGARKGQWTASQVADLAIIGRSIKRDGVPADELVPPIVGHGKLTAAEITAAAATSPASPAAEPEPMWDPDDPNDPTREVRS